MRLGVVDGELRLALERGVAGVLDDDLELGLVALAQEAGEVGADHQLLDALGVLLAVAHREVARRRRGPDLPRGHRVGHLELDRDRTVGAGQQVGLEEGRLGEVRAKLDRGRFSDAEHGLSFRQRRRHALVTRLVRDRLCGGSRLRRRSRGGRHHQRSFGHHPSAPEAHPRSADTVGIDRDEGVRRRGLDLRERPPVLLVLPDAAAGAERRLQAAAEAEARVERRGERHGEGAQRVEAAVVHRGDQLGRAGAERAAEVILDADREALAAARAQLVAEGREVDHEPLVVPGHGERGAPGDELVVGDQARAHGEAAAVRLRHRDLEPGAVASGRERPAPLDLLTADPLDEEGLSGPARVHPEARGAAGHDPVALETQGERRRERRRLAGDDEVGRHLEALAEAVLRLVAEAVGAWREPAEPQRAPAVLAVAHAPLRQLAAVGEAGEQLAELGGRSPPRAQRVSRCPEALPGALFREPLGHFGGERGLGGRRDREEPPGPLAGARPAIEIGALERELDRLRGELEVGGPGEAGLDADPAEAERAFARAGLAAVVGHLGARPEAVGGARVLLALVGFGGERDLELPVGVERSGAGGDQARPLVDRHAPAPEPPPGADDDALDPPGDAARGDRQAEVVTGLAGELRGAVEPRLFARPLERDLEGRPLVLLDADRGRALRVDLQVPVAEQPAGGDEKAPGEGAESVGRALRLGDPFAVGVDQGDRHRRVRHQVEPSLIGAAAEGEHLELQRLPGPVETAIGEDQGARAGLDPAAPPPPVLEVEQSEILAAPRQHEVPAAGVGGGFDPGQAVDVRNPPGSLPRRAAPVVAVGDDDCPADRRAGRSLDQPQLGLRSRLGEEHEIGEGEADRFQPVARARKVRARRGDQQVDPLRLERWRAVRAVATVVGCGG